MAKQVFIYNETILSFQEFMTAICDGKQIAKKSTVVLERFPLSAQLSICKAFNAQCAKNQGAFNASVESFAKNIVSLPPWILRRIGMSNIERFLDAIQ